ncbi:MAG: GMC oxidoreductase [bacterium]
MRVVVVGSGASAVHFARTLLDRGDDVLMVDVGREGPPPINVEDSFEDLKRNLEDPAAYLLGERLEGVRYPGVAAEDESLPPHRAHLFEPAKPAELRAEGFAPRLSLARGGLAEAWTGGAYPWRREETVDFPFPHEDLAAAYDVVAERIGVSGAADDLAARVPVHRHLLPPLPLDEHSEVLLQRYGENRLVLRRLGAVFGRARNAVLPHDGLGRKGCTLLGRCALGCPTESLWTPSAMLRELRARARFEYRPGLRAKWFRADDDRRVRALVVERLDGAGDAEIEVERLALGAGTLASTRIFLESWRRAGGEPARLAGLMDNRQVLVPFLSWRMIRRRHDARTYQYHQLALALDGFEPRNGVVGLVTTLKTASVHALAQRLPFDLRTGLRMFRDVHAALGEVSVSFPDHRRRTCWAELADGPEEGGAGERPLVVRYEPPTGETALIGRTLVRVRRALAALGALAVPGATRVRPTGASAHYAGTLPMTREDRPFTATPDGASRDFAGLDLIDGATFPFLPASSPAFTLMANATRIAGRAR